MEKNGRKGGQNIPHPFEKLQNSVEKYGKIHNALEVVRIRIDVAVTIERKENAGKRFSDGRVKPASSEMRGGKRPLNSPFPAAASRMLIILSLHLLPLSRCSGPTGEKDANQWRRKGGKNTLPGQKSEKSADKKFRVDGSYKLLVWSNMERKVPWPRCNLLLPTGRWALEMEEDGRRKRKRRGGGE